jgi:hypothetical protein
MVGKATSRKRFIGPILLLLLALALLFNNFPFSAEVKAQGIEGTRTFLKEKFTVELNEVGDAHYTDVLVYDDNWFAKNSKYFEEYPFLLSRRYRSEGNIREVDNFDVQVDKKKSTVTITFDTPGAAYNMGDYWILFGYPTEPEEGEEMVFESEGTLSNEFTLWDTMDITTRTTVKLPPGATNSRYDTSKKAVVYELPYPAAPKESALVKNRALFIALFGLLILISLILLAVSLLMKRRARPVAAVTMPATPPIIPSTTPPTPPGSEVSTPPPVIVPSPPVMGKHFCKYCGRELTTGTEKFCKHCGKQLT